MMQGPILVLIAAYHIRLAYSRIVLAFMASSFITLSAMMFW